MILGNAFSADMLLSNIQPGLCSGIWDQGWGRLQRITVMTVYRALLTSAVRELVVGFIRLREWGLKLAGCSALLSCICHAQNRQGLMLRYKVAGCHLPGLSMGAIGLLLQEGQQGLQVGYVGGGGGGGGGP